MKLKAHKNTNVVEFLETRKDFEAYNLKRMFKIKGGFKYSIKKSGGKSKRMISGYAATIDKDRTDDIITIEALQKSKDDLLQPGAQTVFYNHDRSKAIGRTVATRMDSKGLIVDIEISKAKDVDDVWLKIKEGVLNSLSIGGRFKKVQVERDGEGHVIAFKILELELFENSVVGIPMNPKASIFSVAEKSFKGLIDRPVNKKGKKMKTKSTEKETTEKEVPAVVTPVTEDKVKGLIKEAVDLAVGGITKSLETISASIAALTPKADEKKVEGAPAPEKKSTEEIPAWAKSIQDSVASLTEKVGTAGKKKGVVEEEETEELEVPVKPKIVKAFSDSLHDEDACKYASYVMAHSDKYKALPEDEKVQVKGLYLKMMDRKNRKPKQD